MTIKLVNVYKALKMLPSILKDIGKCNCYNYYLENSMYLFHIPSTVEHTKKADDILSP